MAGTVYVPAIHPPGRDAMQALVQAWLPIVVAAVGVFVASSLVHMLFKWHQSEYRSLANEDAVRAAIRAGDASPGLYVLPHCADMKQMREEAMLAKYREGPIGFLTLVPPGEPRMGKHLVLWFAYNLLVAAAGAVLAFHYVGPAGHGHAAGHLAGVLALLAYGGGPIQQGIWMGKTWSAVAKELLDALIYAVVTALAFAWLWS
jgi:hypothetical protein